MASENSSWGMETWIRLEILTRMHWRRSWTPKNYLMNPKTAKNAEKTPNELDCRLILSFHYLNLNINMLRSWPSMARLGRGQRHWNLQSRASDPKPSTLNPKLTLGKAATDPHFRTSPKCPKNILRPFSGSHPSKMCKKCKENVQGPGRAPAKCPSKCMKNVLRTCF